MMELVPSPQPVTWRIEYQNEGIKSGGPGGFVEGVTFGWVTSTGIHGTTFIARGEITPDSVARLVGDDVALRVASHSVTGTVGP